MDLQGGDAEPLQMSVPGRAIGEDAILMFAQAGDDGAGERAGAHIGHGFVIDDVVAMPGAQQFEEVETPLRTGGPEPGEVRVADLGAEAVLGLVARPGVVDRDPAAFVKPARSTARASSRKLCLPAISRRTTCRLEITTPNPRNSVTSRADVTCP